MAVLLPACHRDPAHSGSAAGKYSARMRPASGALSCR